MVSLVGGDGSGDPVGRDLIEFDAQQLHEWARGGEVGHVDLDSGKPE
jgi:hypothetical protein